MKENTKQILKVSICTLVALALFVGVILMCIYFAFDNSSNSVARAEETSSEELLFDDERTILIDEVTSYPYLSNCVYVNSSFDFSLLETPLRSLISDSFSYEDRFTHVIARIYREETDSTFQYLYLLFWEGDFHLVLSTDEYISQIRDGNLLEDFDTYLQIVNFLSEFSVWHVKLYISENEFITEAVYSYKNYMTYFNIGISTNVNTGGYFDSFVDSIINTSPYFVDDSHDGVLYVPISLDSDLTINPYMTKTDYHDLSNFIERFSFTDYTPSYNEAEDFYSFVDGSFNGLDFSFGYSSSAGEFAYLFDGDFYFMYQYPTIGPFLFSSYEWIDDSMRQYRFEITDIKPLYYDVQHFLNYELHDGYCSDLGLIISSSWGYLTSSYIYASRNYDDLLVDVETEIEDLQNQINQNNSLIEELREELRYYESLDLNMSLIDVFNPARMKSSTFVYDGVTYTSNSIVSTDDGWSVYSSTYYNQELPPNYGVGFSLFLPESISNTKFYVYGDITGWYNYTYCTEPDEQGNQTCYNVTDMIPDISVGYRNQNGNIVKVGTFTSNLPGAGGVDFFVDTPTNEIVFFVENCNLMRVGRSVQVSYYQYDTQSIYNDGYENGKSQGIKIGREEGYYQGVADANDYSFFSLFTSVFDAPITAIVGKWGDSDGDGVYQREGGMLNFYIPGLDINFAPFLLSLFTIAIIILVIRFIMARKS